VEAPGTGVPQWQRRCMEDRVFRWHRLSAMAGWRCALQCLGPGDRRFPPGDQDGPDQVIDGLVAQALDDLDDSRLDVATALRTVASLAWAAASGRSAVTDGVPLPARTRRWAMMPRVAQPALEGNRIRRRATRLRSSHLRWALLASSVHAADRLGASRRLQRRRVRLAADVAEEEVRAVVTALRAPAGQVGVDEPAVRRGRVVPTLCDVSVAIIDPDDGCPGQVVKVARTEESANELRRQRDVLTVLRGDHALGPWRALLPEVLELREGRHGAPLVGVETLLPGTSLEALLSTSSGPLAGWLLPATEAIDVLHRHGGRIETIEAGHLRYWVDEPLELLHRTCSTHAPAFGDTVTRLGRELHEALLGQRTSVSWTHGDFTPGNVLIDERTRRVTGLVDWGGGRPHQLALLDHHTMLLAAICHRRRQAIGAVVTDRLSGGTPAPDALSIRDLLPRPAPTDVLDDRTLTLVSWLRHVAEMQRKCGRYRTHRVWWALNVEPVLWALTVRRARSH
jgi:hypothetical protein